MKVKVAVFGQENSVNRIARYTERLEDVDIFPFIYKQAEETPALIQKAIMCDIYLFIGALPYLYAKPVIDKKRLPAVQVDYDPYMILTALYHVKNRYGNALERLSIDIPDTAHVADVLYDTGLDDHAIHTHGYGDDPHTAIGQIARWHEAMWRGGWIDHALTSIPEVAAFLNEKRIPASCMTIPKLNLMRAVDKAKSIAAVNRSQSAQIVAGHVRIKHFETMQAEKGGQHTQALQQTLHHMLLNYARKTHASVVATSDDQFVLFGTRGMLDHITSHYRDFPLLKNIESELATPVDIGFGLGLTAKQAEDNAKLALGTCANNEDGTCYIANERRDLIGPLGVKKEFNPSTLYRSLIHKAKLNNELSYNFIDFIEVRNNEPFSSNDIANYYGVTKRSAERTIKKLMAGDVIKAIGEEKPYVKGRPRKLFKLNQ